MPGRQSSFIGKLARAALVLAGLGLVALAGFWAWGMPKSEMRGQWQTEGYGIVTDIGRFTIDIREQGRTSCERYQLAPANLWLLKNLGGIEFEMSDGDLVIREASTVNPITTNRLEAMPAACDRDDEPDAMDPEWNFQVYWDAFDELYAFFDLYGVDWDAVYTEFRPLVTADTTQDELYDIFVNMVLGLDDGHVFVFDPVGERGDSPDIDVTWIDQYDTARLTAKTYMSDAVFGVEETGLSYGWLEGNIGYMRFAHMEADAPFGSTGAETARRAIEQAADVFKDAKGIIADIRFNPGGDDQTSLAYAGAFTDQPVAAFSKVTKTLDGFTKPHRVMTQPNGNVYLSQPVILLTSGYSISAAEIFTMAMRELPQVTVIGQATSGAHSDVLSRNLPNGWEFGFSHQVYKTPDGTVYEGPGIPPDIEREFDVDGFGAGRDTMLEEAMAMLGG